MVKAEFILGLLGGIIGFFAAIGVLFIGAFASAFGVVETTEVSSIVSITIIASIIGIIGAALSGSRPKAGGGLMIISGIVGLIAITFVYLLSAVLLIVGGVMALRSKKPKRKK